MAMRASAQKRYHFVVKAQNPPPSPPTPPGARARGPASGPGAPRKPPHAKPSGPGTGPGPGARGDTKPSPRIPPPPGPGACGSSPGCFEFPFFSGKQFVIQGYIPLFQYYIFCIGGGPGPVSRARAVSINFFRPKKIVMPGFILVCQYYIFFIRVICNIWKKLQIFLVGHALRCRHRCRPRCRPSGLLLKGSQKS